MHLKNNRWISDKILDHFVAEILLIIQLGIWRLLALISLNHVSWILSCQNGVMRANIPNVVYTIESSRAVSNWIQTSKFN